MHFALPVCLREPSELSTVAGSPGGDFKHLLLDQHREKTEVIFDEFQRQLAELSVTIDERNKERQFPCNAFNPKTMVAGVSI